MNLRAAFSIAGLEVRRRIRDRSILIQGILGPVGLALIIGAAFGGGGSAPFTVTVLVVDEDGSAISSGFVDGLDAASDEPDGPPIDLVPVDDRATATARAVRDDVPAMILPAGFAAGNAGVEVLVPAGRPVAGDLVEAIAARAVATVRGARIAAEASGAVPTGPPPAGLMIEETSSGGDFDAVSYFAPAMAMLFLFFTVGATARSLLVARQDGTLARVRSAPITDATVLAGTALASIVVGIVSVGSVWAITALGFGAEWGDPVLVAVVLGLLVVVIAAIGAIIAGVTRTENQAGSITAAVAFVLALLGGSFGDLDSMPGVLQTVSELTPNGVALRSLVASGAGGATIGDELGSILLLAAMAAVTAVLGGRLVAERIR